MLVVEGKWTRVLRVRDDNGSTCRAFLDFSAALEELNDRGGGKKRSRSFTTNDSLMLVPRKGKGDAKRGSLIAPCRFDQRFHISGYSNNFRLLM